MIAFHMIFAPVLVLGVVLPLIGVHIEQLSFVVFPIAVMIFYVAIVRYQFAQVDELNVSLEIKVEERTAELKQAHSKLIHSEKMASMGQLVAGIAHEVNNPLGAVRSMAQSNKLAADKLKSAIEKQAVAENAEIDRFFDVMGNANRVIEDGTKKVAEVIETLRNFANLDEADFQQFDVHEGLEDTLKILQHEFKENVKLTRNYGDVPKVNCFPAQINQVFLNILTNANEAIVNEGEITVSTYTRDDTVYVKIKDTGVGIPEENRKRIFDPGFTTKGVGVGTGLGLAICYKIVNDHNGDIRVESKEGEGSAFTVVLPVDSNPINTD
jgi:signal transduction histidine kinase